MTGTDSPIPVTDLIPELEQRNRMIYERYLAGDRAVELAQAFGISVRRYQSQGWVSVLAGTDGFWLRTCVACFAPTSPIFSRGASRHYPNTKTKCARFRRLISDQRKPQERQEPKPPETP